MKTVEIDKLGPEEGEREKGIRMSYIKVPTRMRMHDWNKLK